MNSSKLIHPLAVFAVGWVSVAAAVPVVQNVQVSQDRDDDRTVTVRYALTEDAVVTVDFQTNSIADASGDWVSIGAGNFTSVTGDVNRLVGKTTSDERRALTWPARADWPDVRAKNFRAVVTAWAKDAPPDYMLIDLTTKSNVTYYVSADALPFGSVTNRIYKDQYMVFRRIPAAGKVTDIGVPYLDYIKRVQGLTWSSSTREHERSHRVMLTRDYYIGVYEVTEAQYTRVSGDTVPDSRLPQTAVAYRTLRGWTKGCAFPAFDSNGDFDFEASHAVDSNSWFDKFRKHSGLAWLDLPTEAQWFIAAMAGDRSGIMYNNLTFSEDNMSLVSRWIKNDKTEDCEGKTGNSKATVGTYAANAYGLYDTIGNVVERMLDYYEDWTGIDQTKVFVDPVGPASSSSNARAGSWGNQTETLGWAYLGHRTSAVPGNEAGNDGFRVALHLW